MRSQTAIFFCVLLPLMTRAQQRFEIAVERNKDNADYTLVPMYEQGLALINELSKTAYDRENKWNIALLDTALQAQFNAAISLDDRYTLLGHDYNSGKVYFLFYNSEQHQAPYHLVRIDPSSRMLTRYNIAHELDYTLSFFYVVADNALFGGKVSKEPLVMSFNLERKNTKIIPGFFQGNTELLDVHPNANNSFSILMQKKTQSASTLDLKILSTTGEVLFQAQTKIDNQYSILTGFSSSLITDELVVSGTWAKGKSKMAGGIYSWRIRTGDESPQFVNFLELNEFIAYQNKKQQDRLQQKASRRKKKGNPFNYYANVRPTRLEENQNGFFLHAEVKEVVSAPVNRNPYQSMAYPSAFGYRDFYGPLNQYYHPNQWYAASSVQEALVVESVAIQFDDAGRLKNDFSMPMKNIRGDYAEQKSDFLAVSDQLTFAFKDGSSVYRKRVNLGNNQAVLDTLSLLPPDRKKGEELQGDTGIRFWYGNTFYAWGYQSYIPYNADKSVEVFYLSKVKAQ